MSSSGWPSNRALVWLAVVIVFAAICFRLGYLPLLAPDEGRNAEIGREMKESGAWLVRTYNRIDYLDKPALYFKVVSLSLGIIGNNETAARLPSAAFGVGLVGLVLAFCRRVHGMRCGLLAAIIVATTPLYLANARTVIFDTALAFFVCGAIFAGYLAELAEGNSRRNWYLIGAALAGLATLVKGPVGFLVPGLVLLVFNLTEGRAGAWRRMLAPLKLLVFFGVTLPWFVGLCLVHPDFLYYGLVEESFHRFTSAKSFHRSEPFYFYPLIVAGTFFPWSLLLPEAALARWKNRWAMNSADRLCLTWSVVVVLFFSLSQSKLPGYILSVTVACGILAARIFEKAIQAPGGAPARLVSRATVAFALACLIAAVVALAGASHVGLLAKPLRIPVSDAEHLGNGAPALAGLLLAFTAFGFVARYRRSALICFLCLALFPPLAAIAGLGMFEVIFDAKSGRRIAEQLAALPPETELACLQCFPNGLPFYLERTATLITRDGEELTSNYIVYRLKNNSRPLNHIVPLADFNGWLASRTTPLFLVARRVDQEKLQAIAGARNTKVQALSPAYIGAQLPAPVGP